VTTGDWPPELVEDLATAYHELYCDLHPNGDADAGPGRSWDELDEATREDNRGTARELPRYLAMMGYVVRPRCGDPSAVVTIPSHQVEEVAELEHERWMKGKHDHGYVYGPRRDDHASPPTHPHLLPWSELDDSAQEKDRVRIRDAPHLLRRLGFEVIRIDQGPRISSTLRSNKITK
jgi:hypothetical protein